MNKDNLNLLFQLFTRFRSEKPAFFKKLQQWALGIAILLVLAIMGIQFFGLFNLGEKGDKAVYVLWLIISFLGGSVTTAQTATTKAELQDEKTKENVIKSISPAEIHEIKYK